jgi:hypothetical protein
MLRIALTAPLTGLLQPLPPKFAGLGVRAEGVLPPPLAALCHPSGEGLGMSRGSCRYIGGGEGMPLASSYTGDPRLPSTVTSRAWAFKFLKYFCAWLRTCSAFLVPTRLVTPSQLLLPSG